MHEVILFITEHADYAHWVIFGALLLAGFNVPVSEDLMIIIAGVLAGTVVPENLYKLFLAVFFGCYLSDWIAYWLGRKYGPKLMKIRWFSKFVDKDRLAKVQNYFKRYGFLTLLIGRFIPFGVRNCLFISAGMGRMPFLVFLIADGIACFLSNSILFSISYTFAEYHEEIQHHLKTFNIILFSVFGAVLIAFLIYKRKKKKS